MSSHPSRFRSAVWRRISKWLRLRDPKRDLSSILTAANPKDTYVDRVAWVGQLVEWLRGKAIEDVTNKRLARTRFLIQLLERQDELRVKAGAVILSILADSEAPSLFAQTALSEQSGLFSELARRSLDRFLPPAPRIGELSYAVEAIFTDEEDPEWIEALSEDDWIKIVDIISSGAVEVITPPGDRLANDLNDAIVKLSVQAAALGLSSDVRVRLRAASGDHALEASPFMMLNRAAVQWTATPAHLKKTDGSVELRATVAICERSVALGFAGIENSGVSLALVYKLETIQAMLKRLELLVNFVDANPNEKDRALTAHDLLIAVVQAHRDRHSIRALFTLNFDLFSRKLVEHAGESGEHYITRTKREYFAMFRAAAGGGLITIITAMAKFAIGALHFPLFFEGLALAVNYSTSFLAMQALGFALATKQPSMTAAALAGRLSEKLDRSRLSEFVDEVARITRSQFISAVGNVGLVVPGAMLVDYLFLLATGNHVLGAAYAVHTLDTFHPWKSASVLYAAMTGVLLWLSSLGAGWLQNWVIFRRLPESLAADRKLRAVLGEHRSEELGQWTKHNASGWGGNISIGFLLAYFPVIGKVFGLPLDVRHVTLTAGAATFAFCALEPAMITPRSLVETSIGVVLIGVMNFGVSTACALFVAVRARKVRKVWFLALLAAVRRGFIRRPLRFFFPTKESVQEFPAHPEET